MDVKLFYISSNLERDKYYVREICVRKENGDFIRIFIFHIIYRDNF